jgi:hypothetical protein
MKYLEEQIVGLELCLKLAKKLTETVQMLKQVYGEECLRRELRGGETRPGCCTTTRDLFKCPSSSVNIDEARDDCRPPTPCSPELSPADF